MKKLILKLFLISFPILFILAIYFYNDPFKVLYHYDSYFPKDGVSPVVFNKDFVSTQTFINYYPKYHYDSYIFGNSQSMYYHINEWKKHINAGNCYHFDASGEGLYGIERKFQFLSNRGVIIKNALIVINVYFCSSTKNSGVAHILKKSPELSGEKNFDFQMECLREFIDIPFLKVYIPYLFTHRVSKKAIDELLLDNVPQHYDIETNELTFPRYDSMIAYNRDSFYIPRLNVFYKRDSIQKYNPQTIKEEQENLLYNIKRILEKNHTNYRLVISPLYDQIKFDTTDLKKLYSIFGQNNVYDFSGINSITQNMYNYYENSHHRPFIANWIMDSIYHDHS